MQRYQGVLTLQLWQCHTIYTVSKISCKCYANSLFISGWDVSYYLRCILRGTNQNLLLSKTIAHTAGVAVNGAELVNCVKKIALHLNIWNNNTKKLCLVLRVLPMAHDKLPVFPQIVLDQFPKCQSNLEVILYYQVRSSQATIGAVNTPGWISN